MRNGNGCRGREREAEAKVEWRMDQERSITKKNRKIIGYLYLDYIGETARLERANKLEVLIGDRLEAVFSREIW